jgi:hypothetical protein
MRQVCQDYANVIQDAAGHLVFAAQIVPQGIQDIATAFVALQQARHQADYDTSAMITPAQAQIDVTWAQLAFADWGVVQADPAADTFLAELLCRGISRR